MLLTILTPSPTKTIYLLGIVHGDAISYLEIQELISLVKPDLLFLELCTERRSYLHFSWNNWKTWLFNSIHRFFVGKEYEIAYNTAIQYHCTQVCLGDQLASVTLQRLWTKTTWWEKCYLLLCSKSRFYSHPSVQQYLMKDREKYMCHQLNRCLTRSNTIVAIVGKMHLFGIQKYF